MNTITSMSDSQMAVAKQIELAIAELSQVELKHTHTLHAGIYARTLHIPAGVAVAGCVIKIETVLIVSGTGILYVGDGDLVINDYAILEGQPGRKQAFLAVTDCNLTMSFATNAKTVDEAEREFTDEFELLQNRRAALCVGE
jgi:hypothetical protein